MKKYIAHSMYLLLILGGLMTSQLTAIEEKIAKDSNVVKEIPGTTATEGGITVLSLEASTLKLKPIDGNSAIDILFKDASVSRDGQNVEKSSLKVGQIVRVHHAGEGEVQVAKAIQILPPANK